MEKILIVDDSSVMRNMLKTELVKDSHKVIEAVNGKMGLEKAKEELPDMVISDINMPIMDGWDFCWQLRKDSNINKIPFIFLSANNEISDRVRGIQLGADDYIIKPFSTQELLARVQSLFLRYKREEEKIPTNRSLTGNLAKMNLPNLLQFLNMNSMSGILEIIYENHTGQIFISEGDLINAVAGRVSGQKALFRILSWKDGNFTFKEDCPVGEPFFQENSLKLIMDGLKQLDELEKIKNQIPPENAVIQLDPALLEDGEFSEAMRSFFKIVHQHKTIKDILDYSELNDFQIYQVITLMIEEEYFQITP